jgi:hypothetical protein
MATMTSATLLCCSMVQLVIMGCCTQAPLDSPLQPGATFGGLLDLRPQQQAPQGSRPHLAPQALQCHQLVVMLETEEVGWWRTICCHDALCHGS